MVRDCMELMGGNGYIEDFVMPKLFRDVNVLPIWEGSGNIIVLDILRAIHKTDALEILVEEIRSKSDKRMNSKLDKILAIIASFEGDPDVTETTSKPLFELLIHLYQITLLKQELDEKNSGWIKPSIDYLTDELNPDIDLKRAPGLGKVAKLIGWDIL